MTRFDPSRADTAAVRAALETSDPGDPIALAVARRVEELTEMVLRQIPPGGGWPAALRWPAAETAIDKAARDLALDLLRRITGRDEMTVEEE